MDTKLIYRINDNGVGPEILHHVFLERGWIEYDPEKHGENGWNMWWKTSRFRTGEYTNLLSFQWINHYPNCTSVTRKDALCRNIKKMRIVHGVNVYNFCPLAFNLPNDYTKFVSEYARLKQQKRKGENSVMWILKPAESSRGRGIFLFKDLAHLQYDCNAVIQQYIADPFLIGGYKFDIRVYVMVPSFHPLQIYVHEEGLVRFSTEKYDLDRPDNIFAHLTNTSINKYSPGYTTDKDQVGHGCKWTISQLRQYFLQNDVDDTFLWHRVTNIIILTLLMQAPSAPRARNCFELYGFDILIDSSLKPWLLEVNFSPALSSDCQADLIAKKAMLHDLLDIVHNREPTTPLHLDIHRTRNVGRGRIGDAMGLGYRNGGHVSSRSISSVWSEKATSTTRRSSFNLHTKSPRPASSKQVRPKRDNAKESGKLLMTDRDRLKSNRLNDFQSSQEPLKTPLPHDQERNRQIPNDETYDSSNVDLDQEQLKTDNQSSNKNMSGSLSKSVENICEETEPGNNAHEKSKPPPECDNGLSGISGFTSSMSRIVAETDMWERPFRQEQMSLVKSEDNTCVRPSPDVEHDTVSNLRKGHLSLSERSLYSSGVSQRRCKSVSQPTEDVYMSKEKFTNIRRLQHLRAYEHSRHGHSKLTFDNPGKNGVPPLGKIARKKFGRYFLIFPFNVVTDQVSKGKLDAKIVIREIVKETKTVEAELKNGITSSFDVQDKIWAPLQKGAV